MTKFTAVIDEVKAPETFATKKGSEFTKQEVVVSIEGKYPNFLAVELTGDQVGTIGNGDVGRKAEFGVFLNGRKGSGQYADRVFMSLRYAEHSFVDGEPVAEEPEDDFDF